MEQSRLGKLLQLLDAKNAIVRRQAAQQIGDVARLHPSQLNTLLSNLRSCIKSQSNWDARVAAALALKEICRNVLSDEIGSSGETDVKPAIISNDPVSSHFDLATILASDFRLLGSEGKEFDLDAANSNSGKPIESSSTDRHAQKLRLAKQLGFLIPEVSNVTEIVTDDDLAYSSYQRRGQPSIDGEHSDYPTPPKLFKLEPSENNIPAQFINEREPKFVLAQFLRSLCGDLYDSNWTSRHGAALALKEAASSSKFFVIFHLVGTDNVPIISASYILLHVFNVLATDRFNDFVGDHVVAPVRETCAQLVTTILLCFRQSFCKPELDRPSSNDFSGVILVGDVLKICEDFLKFSDDPKQWECPHAGLLAIKYIIGATRDSNLLQNSLMDRAIEIFDATVKTLEESNDDVVIAAAQALLPLVDVVKPVSPEKVQSAIDRCWQLLRKHVSPASIEYLQSSSDTPAFGTFVSACDDESAADGLFQLLESSPEPLSIDDGRLVLLLPFFGHSQSYTRQRLCSVLTRSAKSGALILSDSAWCAMLIRTFISCIADTRCETADRFALELWPALVELRSEDEIWNLCRPMLGQWLAYLMVPEQTPLNVVNGSGPTGGYLGGRDVVTLNNVERDYAVVSARLRGACALARICTKLINANSDQNNGDPRHSLAQLVALHLTSNSAFQRAAVCMFLGECSKLVKKNNQENGIQLLFNHVQSIFENILHISSGSTSTTAATASTPTIYDEILHNASEIHAACRDFLSLANANCGGEISAAAIVLNTKEAEQTCARALHASIQSTSSTKKSTELQSRFDQLKELIRRNAAQMDRINIRVLSWLACAYIRIGGVPAKLNPIVQPLMNCLKNESNRLVINETAQCLATLLEIAPASPSAKIVKNLTILHSSDPKTVLNSASVTDTMEKRMIISWETKLTRENTAADCENGTTLITARNAGFALKCIVGYFGDKLATVFPGFYECLTKELVALEQVEQNLIISMQILETVYSSLPESIRNLVRESQIPAMCKNMKHGLVVVRHMACRCLVTMAETDLTSTLNAMLPSCLDLLTPTAETEQNGSGGEGAHGEEYAEMGVVELFYLLVEKLNASLIGIIPLLAVPVLASMSSSQSEIRPVAAYTFGQLVKLMPLEMDDRPLAGLSSELSSLRRKRLEFLHLLNRPEELSRHISDAEGKEDRILGPLRVNAELRSYQRDGIVWLRFLGEYGLHGILCDDMGLGKTLQTLAALVSSLSASPEAAPIIKRNASLIICPKTLTSHWINEIRKFFGDDETGGLKATCIIDRMLPIDFSVFNVVVASYDLFRKELTGGGVMDSILSYKWHYCILDEGHVIRNPKTRVFRTLTQLKSDHRLILSGTPVQNSVLELWALFEFLMPGYLGTQSQFQSRFGKPILLSRDAKASSTEAEAGQAALDNLHKLVLPFILRRRKCDVLDDLPPKIIQDSPCMLSPLQSQLYEDFSRTIKDKFSSAGPGGGSGGSSGQRASVGAFQVLLYLRKLCDHPCLVLDEKYPNYQQIRTKVTNGEFGNEVRQFDDYRLSGKMVALKQLLSECGIGRQGEVEEEDEVQTSVSPHRALIFCQFKAVIALIAQYFDKGVFGKSITYRRLDGDVAPARRQSVVDQFNDDPSIDVLLLSTQIGGLGLNLTGADVVIFVDHDWNPAKDLQAMDRAHRIGQKRTVNVYRLITSGTLEEKIMRLQQFKTRTADSVIGDENRSLMSMATDQLLDLLTLDSGSGAGGTGDGDSKKVRKSTSRKSNGNRDGESAGSSTFGAIDLPTLWDQSQYEEAFDYNTFINTFS